MNTVAYCLAGYPPQKCCRFGNSSICVQQLQQQCEHKATRTLIDETPGKVERSRFCLNCGKTLDAR